MTECLRSLLSALICAATSSGVSLLKVFRPADLSSDSCTPCIADSLNSASALGISSGSTRIVGSYCRAMHSADYINARPFWMCHCTVVSNHLRVSQATANDCDWLQWQIIWIYCCFVELVQDVQSFMRSSNHLQATPS